MDDRPANRNYCAKPDARTRDLDPAAIRLEDRADDRQSQTGALDTVCVWAPEAIQVARLLERIPRVGSREERVEAFVAQRIGLYEKIGAVVRAAQLHVIS